MSAPTSGSADGSSIPGYYPDPSIPHYIRYWDGAAWVPGTSRPAPAEGEALPAPPPGVAAAPPKVVHPDPEPSVVRTQFTAAVPDETGPMFLDEPPADPEPDPAPGQRPADGAAPADASAAPTTVDWDDPRRLHGSRPEPATAWQADAARQGGFGGEQDRRVSWGSGTAPVPDPRSGDRPAPADRAPADGAQDDDGREAAPPAAAEEAAEEAAPPPAGPGGGTPGRSAPGADGTLTLRAVRPGGGAQPGATRRDEGTLTIRAVGSQGAPDRPRQGGGPAARGPAAPGAAAPGPAEPGAGSGPAPAPAATTAAPGSAGPGAGPAAPGRGTIPAQGGGPSGAAPGWAQQVQRLAQPGDRPAAGAPAVPVQATGPGAGGAPPEGVIPWKPPVDNPFLRAARDQGRPAGLGRRLAARLIDSVLLLTVVGAAAVPLWTKAKDHIDAKIDEARLTGETVTVYLLDGTTGSYLGIVLGVLLVAGLLYEALPTAKWGRTLGKKLCGLRTLDIESHTTPTFGSALRRWLVYGVLGVLVIGVVNVVWCLFDRPWRQCWHDKAARTFVATGG
ncbi:RDD family protein [Streptomyces sp. NPDC018031]|uniref:RDD family protein n=1 Tax=Streptomyces sp. NPDC018031 TaxID=3365033 RepID=UPI0037A4A163